MPKKAKATESETPTNEKDATAAVGGAIDWSAYRKAKSSAPASTETEQTEERMKRPRAHWSDLVDIDGLMVVDAFESSGDFGPYTACVVRLPAVGRAPAREVLTFGGHNTQAGKQAHAFYTTVEFTDEGGIKPTPVFARARPTRNPETGEPMNPRIVLTFG